MKKISKVLAIALAAMMLIAAFAGCSKEEATTTAATTTAATTTTAAPTASSTGMASATATTSQATDADAHKYGGVFSMLYNGTVKTWFLFHAQNTQEGQVKNFVYDTYLRINENNEVECRLAEEYNVSEDGMTLTMKLRDNIYWHDGTPITVDDVIFTHEVFWRDEFWGKKDSAVYEKVDEYTFTITLEKPNPLLLKNYGHQYPLPKHVFEGIPGDQVLASDVIFPPVGSGPFKVVEEVVDEYIRLEAFEDYYAGRPYLDQVVLRNSIGDLQAQVAIETGQIHFASIANNQIADITSDAVTTVNLPSNVVRYICFNCKSPILSDPLVRQALNYLTDKDAIRNQFFPGEFATDGLIDRTHYYFTEGNAASYDFNPTKAAELLDQAGWVMGSDGWRYKDGTKLSVSMLAFSSGDNSDLMGQLIAYEAGKVGFEVVTSYLEGGSLAEKIFGGNFDLFYNGSAMGDPNDWFGSQILDSNSSFFHYENDYLKQLRDQAKSEMDDVKRKELILEAERIVTEDCVGIWLVNSNINYIYSDTLHVEEAGLIYQNERRFVRPAKLWIEH